MTRMDFPVTPDGYKTVPLGGGNGLVINTFPSPVRAAGDKYLPFSFKNAHLFHVFAMEHEYFVTSCAALWHRGVLSLSREALLLSVLKNMNLLKYEKYA